MAKLGLPYLKITFIERGIAAIQRSKRGVVALVLQDKKVEGNFIVYTTSDIPEGIDEKNKEQIKLAMMGNRTTPRKLVVAIEKNENADAPKFVTTSPAFKYLETERFDYLAVPFADVKDSQEIATWIKTLNDNYEKRCKAVLANTPADNRKIINYTHEEVSDVEKTYLTTEYTSRIAGLIAGTPPQIATTYATLPELKTCTSYTREEIGKKIGQGEFVLLNDGEKIKVARGVNSLITTSELEGESFRKIKIVEIMDIIADDVQMTAEDSYLGKYANTYSNKILLCEAIKGYLEKLELENLINPGHTEVGIDVEAQKAYLRGIGYRTNDNRNVDEMEVQEIKEADTKDQVFIMIKCKILDAIEEINIRAFI